VTQVGEGLVEFAGTLHVGDGTTFLNDSGSLSLTGTIASASPQSSLELAGRGVVDLSLASYHVAENQSLLITREGTPLTLHVSGDESTVSGPGTLLNPVVVGGSASMAPGASAGTLTVEGDVTIDVDGTLEIELFGTDPGASYDVLRLSGSAALAGALDVRLTDHEGRTFLPARGDTFNILTAADGVLGTFHGFRRPSEVNGYRIEWNLDYLSDGVQLSVADAFLIGDYNGNGRVEQGDLDLVLLNWGVPAYSPPAGWTSDLPSGLVDQDELDGVLLHWGTGTPGGPSGIGGAVPEPATLTALFVFLAGMVAASRCGALVHRVRRRS
jgi:hypothetical protein